MKKIILLILFFYSFPYLGFAQKCNCESNFVWAKKTFEENDAGFEYIIKQKGRKNYEIWSSDLLQKSKKIENKNDCEKLVKEWLSFFRKGHLGFSANNPTPSSKNEKSNSAKSKINIEDFKNYLAKNKNFEYEGIYESDAYKIALKNNNGILEGYVFETSNNEWDLNHLKFFINKDFSGTYFMGDYSEKHFDKAELIDKVLLNLDGIYFKKTFPNNTVNNEEINSFLNSVNAEKPFAQLLNENTYLLRVPSFEVSRKKDIDSLISKYKKDITSKKNLIIDLRGNGGGAGKSYNEILPIIYTNPIKTIMWEHLSTKLNNQRWSDWLKNKNLSEKDKTFISNVNEKLNKNLGKFVYIYENVGFEIFDQKMVYEFPKNIAIIIDENNASATEQFLLSAKQSQKVKIYGSKTFGALDMSEINSVESPDKNFTLYYCLTKSLRLPNFPIDNYGIQPDFYIEKTIPQYKWIEYVNEKLNEK